MSEIIWAMNPRNDTLDSFTAYIRQYASAYLESTGINGRFLFPENIPAHSMSSELRRNLFLTVKEALHNIVKHAGPGEVAIHLGVEGEKLFIRIMDTGKGFLVEENPGRGNGLVNMRKRMEETGGSFELTSVPGKGTTLEFSVSLRVNAKSH
jgi:signal transduction histidine kinase